PSLPCRPSTYRLTTLRTRLLLRHSRTLTLRLRFHVHSRLSVSILLSTRSSRTQLLLLLRSSVKNTTVSPTRRKESFRDTKTSRTSSLFSVSKSFPKKTRNSYTAHARSSASSRSHSPLQRYLPASPANTFLLQTPSAASEKYSTASTTHSTKVLSI